jgi:hypothetical protein
MADLDVIRQRDVFHFDTISQIFTVNEISSRKCDRSKAHSCVSHLPKSLISCPSFEMSFGRVATVAILSG